MLRRTPLKRKTPLKAKVGLKRTAWTVKPTRLSKRRLGAMLRVKRTKLPSIKSVKRKTWTAVSLYIRKRDPWCVTCLMDGRQTPTTEAGHYKHTSDKVNQTLGGNEVWWDERNLNGQCGRCNRHNSGELDLYGIYLEQKFGHGICQELDKLFRIPKKWSREEAAEVGARYSALLSEL